MLSAICRPLAEPINRIYLRSRFSTTAAVRPVSSIVLGSAGRNVSSERIEASKLPPGDVDVAVSVADITRDSASDAIGATTGREAAAENALNRRLSRAKIAYDLWSGRSVVSTREATTQ